MEPRALSEYLRNGDDAELNRRRWIVGLSMLSATIGQIVALYQTGIIRHLPDPPPHSLFQSDRVDASEYAYKRLDQPDAPAMVVTFGITAMLASAGGPDRARNLPWLSLAMAGKTVYDFATAVELAREEWEYNRALCAYCQAATLASAAAVAFAIPEAADAVRTLLRGGNSDSEARPLPRRERAAVPEPAYA